MDYDDHDFHCQNFQLVGEDSNKFSPSLQSVPLPKFDLDDHLQVHHRFDSLVETEALLGIQGQGDYWIEDFSPGGSAVEFSSTAADSCSISRHNNVWSEATSSESVEMLLKSFGEDEMIDQKVISKETDARGGLNGMDAQIDACLSQNNSHLIKMEDKCQESFLGVQPQTDMSQTSNDEKSGIDMDVSLLGEKLNSEGKVGPNLTPSSNYETNSSLLLDETIYGVAHKNNPLHDVFMKKRAADDLLCIAGAVPEVVSDTIGCSTRDDLSSVSTCNISMGPGKSNTQVLSEQAIEEYREIDLSEKFGLFSDKNESSDVIHSKASNLPLQGPAVSSSPCSAKRPSIFSSIIDSSVLLIEGHNEPIFSENPDGLLEAITCQAKPLNEETQVIAKSASQNKGIDTVAIGGDIILEKNSLDNEDLSDLSHLTQGFKNASCGGLEDFSKDDAIHVQSTPTENTKMVDRFEGRESKSVESVEDKLDPEVQLTENENCNVENISESAVKVHLLTDTSAMPMGETECHGDLQSSLLNVTSQYPSSIGIPEYAEDEAVRDIVEKLEVKLDVPQYPTPNVSLSSALLDEAEKTSSLPSKLFDVSDAIGSSVEPHVVHEITPEVSIVKESNTMAPMHSDIANTIVNSSISKEEMQDASSAGQNNFISTVLDCSLAKKLTEDESGVDLATMGATLPTDVGFEQKATSTPPLSTSGFIQHAEKEVEISEIQILESQVSRELIEVSDPMVIDDSSMKGIIHDKQVVTLIVREHSSSSEGGSDDIGCHSEPQSSIDDHLSCQHVTRLEQNLAHASVEGNCNYDSPGVNMDTTLITCVETPSTVERQEMATLHVSKDSSSGDLQNRQESCDANVVFGDDCYRPHDTTQEEGNCNYDSPGLNTDTTLITCVQTPSTDERQEMATLHVSKDFSSGDLQNRQESCEANAAFGHDTTQAEGNCNYDSPGVNMDTTLITYVETPSTDERREMATLHVSKDSSSGDLQNKQESCEANVAFGDDCYRPHDTTQAEGNYNYDSPGVNMDTTLITSVETPSTDERQEMATLLVSKNSSSGDMQNRQESCEANVAFGDDCYRPHDTTQAEGNYNYDSPRVNMDTTLITSVETPSTVERQEMTTLHVSKDSSSGDLQNRQESCEAIVPFGDDCYRPHDTTQAERNCNFDSPGVNMNTRLVTSVETPSTGERQEMATLHVSKDSSSGDLQNRQESCEANVAFGDDCYIPHDTTQADGNCNYDSPRVNMDTTLITSVETPSTDERQEMTTLHVSKDSSSGDLQNRQENCEANVAFGDDCYGPHDTTQAEVETPNTDERQEMATLHVSKDSSSGDLQNRQESCEANVAFGDDCYGPHDTTQAEGTAGPRKFETENANPSLLEQKCGSPTVISCIEHSQDQIYQANNEGLLDQRSTFLDDPLSVSSEAKKNGDKLKSNALDSKESTTSEDDRSFTFEVGSLEDLSERDTGSDWKPFSNMKSFELPQSNLKLSKENSEGHRLESGKGELHGVTSPIPDDDDAKQISGHSTKKPTTSSQGKTVKEKSVPKKTTRRDENTRSPSSKSVENVNKNVPVDVMQLCPYNGSDLRASCSTTVQTSNLPDLNNSVSAATLFHQPFTDLQQIQLRAQIFVYGSLIQGIAPDEACMLAAFGEADGGRGYWEGVWRISAERYHNQKSPFSGFETPSHSRSGTRASEQVVWCSSLQGRASSIPAIRSGSKPMSTALLNSALPLQSPLWSTPTRDGSNSTNMPRITQLDFNQAISPLHSHQSSQNRQHTGNTASWLSHSPLPVAETVQVTPVRDSTIPHTINMQIVSPTVLMPTPGPASVSAASTVLSVTPRKSSLPVTNRSTSTVKSRKKNKGSVPEAIQQNILVSQPQVEPATLPADAKHSPSTTADLHESAIYSAKVAPSGLVSATSTILSPTYYKVIGTGNAENRAILSEETCSKVEQAKLLAEDAAALAASAIMHSQSIWSQLATQKKSGLISEVDEKLASAAVAAAAAASVAKAAAAAAKVASNAALQAKMMADESLLSVNANNPTSISETGLLDMGKSFAKLTPAPLLKGKEKIHCSTSIISAAREAARRRLEAASAATKRAENLDAIVKAAELASEAVSQAGIIIAMGEPLPFTLSELVEAGPEGYWKVHQSTENEVAKTNSPPQEKHTTLDGYDVNRDKYLEQFEPQPPNDKEMQTTTGEGVVSLSEHSVQSEKLDIGKDAGNATSTDPIDRHEKDRSVNSHNKNSIKKGSLVEVVADKDGLWFSARVLDVNDGKAYVCYNDRLPHEGTGQLKEWIPLERDGNKAPRIRIAHPMAAAKYEGTRKRRREVIGNCEWAAGDRVDAWIDDGWQEGIVTERSQGDDTKLNVNFPDLGDTSAVRAWDLRPSLVWKDGQWLEWSRPKECSEVDTPQEKRQKLGGLQPINLDVEGKGLGDVLENLPDKDPKKPEESRPLVLSAKDRVYSAGNNARGPSNSEAYKLRGAGLQKLESKVVFGVPKPGKKRKFMEVSKQYVADKTEKMNEAKTPIKFAKYLMPQTSRVWRNASKVDPKGKVIVDSKPKLLKPLRSQNNQTRSVAQKDNSSSVTIASNGGETGHISSRNTRAGSSNDQNKLDKKSLLEAGPYLGTIEPTHQELSGQPTPSSSKKKSTSAVEADVGVKGKATPVISKPTKNEEKGNENSGKTISDAPEPRRSNRRIQPTSRLLEGLQSSLIVSKIPNFSHDKGTKAHQRAVSSRGNTHG